MTSAVIEEFPKCEGPVCQDRALSKHNSSEVDHTLIAAQDASEAMCKYLRSGTKRARIVERFIALGEAGMNCFEAANRYGEYVLRSTVSDLWRDFGLWFEREPESVPNQFGTKTECVRYFLRGEQIERARELLRLGIEMRDRKRADAKSACEVAA
jgi:hypothetical protein